MYKILVVDDQKTERDGISYLIDEFRYPFQVYTQNNGKTALEFLEKNEVDVIISDIKMPFVDGLELCRQARELYPSVHLILLTAYNDFTYTKQAIQVKVEDYLMKPTSVQEFKRIMDKVISQLDMRENERKRNRLLIEVYQSADVAAKEAILEKLMEDIATQADIGIQKPPLSNKSAVNAALKIINEEYTTDCSLSDLADRIYLSKGYLGAVFKKETSLSVMQYITMLRMQKARTLILQSNMKIVDVCTAVGYRDLSYFCMLFKKFYGVTAASLRNGEADE